MKRLILSILLLILLRPFTGASYYYLALPSAFQNPEAKKKIMDALEAAKTLKKDAKEVTLKTKPVLTEDNNAK